MKFYEHLYVSDSVKGREKEIRKKLENGTGMIGVYFIALPLYGSDPLEIYGAMELKQRWYRRSSLMIVGFAGSLHEAELMSADILMEIHEKQGNYDSRSFFCGRQPEVSEDKTEEEEG